MNKFGKVIALALAATMVFGSSLTAFAGDNDGGSTGTGASEGHVEKKATNVVLPTIPAESSPFAYIMDPEGLIVETTGAKYAETAVFPDSNDTRVYFNNGANDGGKIVYANSSLVQTVENKSSYDIDLTVKAAVTDAATTDIPLVAQNALADATAASLYLGLVVGSGDDAFKKEITAAAAAEKTVKIAGSPDNFEIAVKDGAYVYAEKTGTLEWESDTFNLEGAVTEDLDITSSTTAPKISVTWSWVDHNAEPEATAPSIATAAYDYDRTADLPITVSLGTGNLAATEVSKVEWSTAADGSFTEFAKDTKWTFADTTLTFKSNVWGSKAVGDKYYLKVTFDDTAATEAILELTISK